MRRLFGNHVVEDPFDGVQGQGANGVASFEKPKAAGSEQYVSDPAKPVPFLPRPIDMGDADQWKPWLVKDQHE